MNKEQILTKILDLLEESSIEDATWIIRTVKYKKNIQLGTSYSSTCEVSDGPIDIEFYYSRLNKSL